MMFPSYGIATTETKMISHLQDQRQNDLDQRSRSRSFGPSGSTGGNRHFCTFFLHFWPIEPLIELKLEIMIHDTCIHKWTK